MVKRKDSSREDDSCNVLYNTSLEGHLEAVESLLKNGADVNAEDQDGRTVAMYGNRDVQKMNIKSRRLSARPAVQN